MAKRGRKAKSGARKPCGRLRRETNDLGTPELRQHRAIAVAPDIASMVLGVMASKEPPGGDPRASYALGRLHARGMITGAQRHAGNRYAAQYTRAVGRPAYGSILGNLIASIPVGRPVSDDNPDDVAAQARTDYLETRRMLKRCGWRCYTCVDAVAVYDTTPRPEEMARLRRGLDALREHYERMDKGP